MAMALDASEKKVIRNRRIFIAKIIFFAAMLLLLPAVPEGRHKGFSYEFLADCIEGFIYRKHII